MNDKFIKGFSYIEALIATAIISIMFIPALAGFHSAALNQRYAADRYEAVTQAELAILYIRTPESGDVNNLNIPYLLHDKYDFVINDSSNSVAIDFYHFPEIPPLTNDGWDVNGETHIYTGADDGALSLEGPFSAVSDLRAVTVDVYDKEGVFLTRVVQMVK